MLSLKKQKINQLEKTNSEYCDTFYRNQNGLLKRERESPDLIDLPEKPLNNFVYETEVITERRSIMKDEINVAVTFLIRIIGGSNQLTKQQTDDLQEQITLLLTNKFHNHWHPEKPFKGQAFRCIRVNSLSRSDTILENACQSAGISYVDLKMPIELTLWIDPEEVTCRFGESKGSYCLLAKFKGGNKENFVNQININELEQKSMERQRQASFELMNARKKKYIKTGFNKNATLTSLNSNNIVSGYDVSTGSQTSNYYPFYASSPQNTKYYSTSPPQIQQQQQQPSSSSGLFSPNRMSPYRNFNNAAYMNMSKSMIRNLRTSFDSINATLSHEPAYQGVTDRYHWMNKSIVKA